MTKLVRIFIFLILAHISGEGKIRALADQAIKNFPICVIQEFQNSALSCTELNTVYQTILTSMLTPSDSSITMEYLDENEWLELSELSSGGWNEWISRVMVTRLCYPAERIFKSGVCLWIRLSEAHIDWRVPGEISSVFSDESNSLSFLIHFLIDHWNEESTPLAAFLFRLSYSLSFSFIVDWLWSLILLFPRESGRFYLSFSVSIFALLLLPVVKVEMHWM